MREVPWDVLKAVHDKDPLVSIAWDQEIHKWMLSWDGQRICALFHEDGSDMMELNASEILSLLDRFDNFKDGPDRIRKMRQRSADARKKAALREEFRIQESMREAERVHKVLRQGGASPQVYIHREEKTKC